MPAVQMFNNWQYYYYSYLDLFSIMVFRQIINIITLSVKRWQAAFQIDNDYCTMINSNCKLKLSQTKRFLKCIQLPVQILVSTTEAVFYAVIRITVGESTSTSITALGPRQNKHLVLKLQISRFYFVDLYPRICV